MQPLFLVFGEKNITGLIYQLSETDIPKLAQSEKLMPNITFDSFNNDDVVRYFIWTANLQPVTESREML